MTRERAVELLLGEASSLARGNMYANDDHPPIDPIHGLMRREIHDGTAYLNAVDLARRFGISPTELRTRLGQRLIDTVSKAA